MNNNNNNNNKCPVLTKDDLREIVYLSKQGGGRSRLICNLYRLDKIELSNILKQYN